MINIFMFVKFDKKLPIYICKKGTFYKTSAQTIRITFSASLYAHVFKFDIKTNEANRGTQENLLLHYFRNLKFLISI